MHPKLPPTPESTGRVVIDFDGVLAEGVWPENRIGKPIGQGIAILIFYAAQGREVVVYTARPESHKERILAWLRMAGLQDKVYDVVCGKPVADLYVDDKAWNPWNVEELSPPPEEGRGVSPPGDGQVAVESGPSSTYPWIQGQVIGDQDEEWVTRQLGAVNG